MGRTLSLYLILGLQLAFNSCASAQAAAQFSSLENRLLAAQALSLEFQITASGAVEANISGTLQKTRAGSIRLSATGLFAGQSLDVIAEQDAQRLRFGNSEQPQSSEPAAQLWESLVFGFTRMGVLHNIANLSVGAAPDHAAGGVREWVVVSNMARDGSAFQFDITVAGVPSGSASLAVDEGGTPLLREQTVAFPGGEMQVVESYSNVALAE